MDLERLQRVLVVGGHEDHHRHLLGADLADHAEAVDGGHLHVEKHELGRQLLDGVDGLHAVGALPHDLDVGFLREQPQDPLARHQRERQRAGDLGKSLLALVQDFKPEQKKQDRLVVKSGGRVFFVRTDDIDWIEASGNYVRLHLKEQSYLFRETMNQMESRLDTQRFFRIHRSRIVNTERIKELQPWFNGEYVVVLHNGTQLRLSRSYREKLEERLGKAL